MRTYTLSKDGHDLGTRTEVPGGNWDRMWKQLTDEIKAEGQTGRWYLYMHEITEETETWSNLKHFIELH